ELFALAAFDLDNDSGGLPTEVLDPSWWRVNPDAARIFAGGEPRNVVGSQARELHHLDATQWTTNRNDLGFDFGFARHREAVRKLACDRGLKRNLPSDDLFPL